ncbi:hypothetical protein J2S74_002591 [Evansella vedderi]|uniref:Ribosomal protein L32 n=1 Tax=Evansella vedderi TaxID=38282 RepID=A0ABT9ZVE5_9BACI|nr:hypothetical protein [Evansella vedderi]MDQ0255209.1 hypothetical protein [Evansella vedderi]
MPKKYKLSKTKHPSFKEDKNNGVRFHYQVYIQEERSIHPKDVDEIEY